MLDWLTQNNLHRIIEIHKVKEENTKVKTIFFRDKYCVKANPGQFVMVWIPKVDEIPLCISTICEDGFSSVTVAEVGEATKALNKKRRGESVGVRGPFGNYFKVEGETALLVGGGIGVASLIPLLNNLVQEGKEKIFLVYGARTKSDFLFLEKIKDYSRAGNIQSLLTTEDGSLGIKGIVTDTVEQILKKEEFDIIYTCGPEAMIQEIYLLAEKIGLPIQASLERNMRCAVGICGSCTIGKYRVCRDGPIFKTEQLREIVKELNKFKYDFSGKKIPVETTFSMTR